METSWQPCSKPTLPAGPKQSSSISSRSAPNFVIACWWQWVRTVARRDSGGARRSSDAWWTRDGLLGEGPDLPGEPPRVLVGGHQIEGVGVEDRGAGRFG